MSIVDNDITNLTVDDVTVDESAGIATVIVSVDHAVQGGFTVDYATADGTAVDPDDYLATTGTLTFTGAAGETQSFTVTIIGDMVFEPMESLTVSLSNVQATEADPADIDSSDTASVTIVDSVALAVDDVTVDESLGTATVIVSVEGDIPGGFTVDYATVDGTAVAPDDYLVAAGTLTFAGTAGETQSFVVTINDDDILEMLETLNVTLSNVQATEFDPDDIDATDSALVTIVDDDTALLTMDDVIVDESAGIATVIVSVDNAVQGGFTVDYATADGSAVAPDDYVSATGTLTFAGAAGESQSLTITIIENMVFEPMESLTVSLSNVQALEADSLDIDASDVAIVTIVDNDTAILTVDDVMVNESAGTATLTVSVDSAIPGGFSVDFATSDGTASEPGDYQAASGTLIFAGTVGESQSFVVTINDDDILEIMETLNVTLGNVQATEVDPDDIDASDTAVVTIADNDTAILTVDEVVVDESVGTAIVVVSIDNAVQGGFTVDFATSDDTAIAPDDYLEATGTLTFTGIVSETQSFVVTINDDDILEIMETLNVTLSNVQAQAGAAGFDTSDIGLVTIVDNDSAHLTVNDLVVDESAGTVTVIVSVDNSVQGGFSVDYATSNGTAVAPDDYLAATGTLMFTGEAAETQTFTVTIVEDMIFEPMEFLTVSLSNVQATEADATDIDASDTAVVTIVDDNAANLNVDDVIVDESAGTVTVTVSVDNAVQGGFTVDYSTSDATAVAPNDYVAASGTLAFAGTVAETQSFVVTINDDDILELMETFGVTLSNVQATQIDPNGIDISDTAEVTIVDDETATLSMVDVVVDESVGVATIVVSVDNPVQGGFAVDFVTFDGTAVESDDYDTASGTLTFSGTAGETQSFTVTINDDDILELLETLNVTLSNVQATEADPGDIDASDTALVSVVDNDTAVLTVDDVTVDESAATATVIVSIDNAVQGGFTVDFATSDGTALAPSDYLAATDILTFAGTVGETQSFVVTINNDDILELTESFAVMLSNVQAAEADSTGIELPDTVLVTIVDNDTANLNIDDVIVSESTGMATVVVSVDNAVQGGFTVDYATADGTAVDPDDYLAATGTLTFTGAAGETQSFTVTIIGDMVFEPMESLTVSLSNVQATEADPADIDASDTAEITIVDGAKLTVDDVAVDESTGTATVIVSVEGDIPGGFTVDYATVDGTAVAPDDYLEAAGTLTFAGTTGETQSFVVTINDDDILEMLETLNVTLSNVQATEFDPDDIDATDTALVTIVDNDTATLTVDNVAVDESSGTATVTVTVNNGVQGGFTVDYATSDGTAVAPDDYLATSGTLTFTGLVGESQSFVVTINDDMILESLESLHVALSNVQTTEADAAGIDASDSGLVTIVDDDTANLNIFSLVVNESTGMATLQVTVDNAVPGGFTVDYATADGSAVAPDDYVSATGTLTFAGAAGETQSFTVTINDDEILESAEGLFVILSNVQASVVDPVDIDASDTAQITIIDNDSANLTVDDVTVNETSGVATVVVSVDKIVPGGFSVDYATADGTAVAPDDYLSTTGTLTFSGAAGETQSFTVTINDDVLFEIMETLTVTLSNIQATVFDPSEIDASDVGVVTIVDDDSANLMVDDVFVDETSGTAMVVVTVDNVVPGGFTVDYATSDGTAVAPDDYVSATGTLTFAGAAGENQSFTVSINDDDILELLETLNVTLSNVQANE